MKRALILFDIDGTLVDSEAMILAAQAEAFAAFLLPMPERMRVLSIVGLSLHEAFTVLAGPDGPVEGLVNTYSEAFARLRDTEQARELLFDGAQAALQTLVADDGLWLGVATGKSRRGVDRLVAAHAWHGYFHTIQTADDAPSKPHPAMILQACAEIDLTPERAIMVGDSSYDMAMARTAGARAIGVAWGFQPREALVTAGAEMIVEDFGELCAVIDRISR